MGEETEGEEEVRGMLIHVTSVPMMYCGADSTVF